MLDQAGTQPPMSVGSATAALCTSRIAGVQTEYRQRMRRDTFVQFLDLTNFRLFHTSNFNVSEINVFVLHNDIIVVVI